MDVDWSTFILEAINFLVLVVLLHRFLYQPVQRIIGQRQALIARTLEDAEAEKARAADIHAHSEAERQRLAQEREQLLEVQRQAIQEERQRVLAEARAQADDLMRAVRQELARERAEAQAEVRAHAAEVAVTLAESLLRQADIESVTEIFMDRAIKHLGSLPAGERQRLVRLQDSQPRITVATEPALDSTAQERWRARLRELAGDDAIVEFEREPALVAGVELRLGGGIVRYAWGEALRAATQELLPNADAA